MKRRTVTVGQMMRALVPMALVLWLARPAVRILAAGVVLTPIRQMPRPG